MRELKRQNRVVIKWFERVEPERTFLRTPDRDWTYGGTVDQINRRSVSQPRAVSAGIDAEGVFGTLAGVAGGGVLMLTRGIEISTFPDLDGASLVVFTSGTSGSPKGVRLTASNLEAACQASVEHLGHGPSDTWLVAMPMSHVGGISALLRSAYAGGSVRLLPEFDPNSFASAMHDDVTMVSVVPTMLHRLLDHDPGPYAGLRAVLVGGGPIPKGLLERAVEAGLPVLPTYGMTETFGQIATLRPDSPVRYHTHPLPGVDVRIDDDGRIALRSRQISRGYLGESDRDDPWFVTSDVGEVDKEGALRVIGRADAVIVTGGENVNPERVEVELVEHDEIDQAVIVGLPDVEWGSILVCLYVGSGEAGDFSDWLRGRLPGFMVPKRFIKVEAIPRTELGKVDRVVALGLAADG